MPGGGAGTGLLSGLAVLDLSVWRPGPAATQLLAEIGADVIKVEPPGGDPMRAYPDLFASLNANKRSVLLDLKTGPGRDRALDLAERADVVVEGFRPGVVDRLGVGYGAVRARQPAVVYCAISGMGQTGPLSGAAGHDLNFAAWAGVLAPEGGPPVVPAVPVADLAAGTTAAFAICAAVVRRLVTGEGEYIDLAMADVLATWAGAAPPRAEGGPADPAGVPGYGVFTAADGVPVSLGVVSEDHLWRALCDGLGLGDGRDLPFAGRLARAGELQDGVRRAVGERRGAELVEALLALGVPVAPVQDRAGMLATEHFVQRGVSTADPWRHPATGYPVRFSAHPARRTSPPPALDEHAGATFGERPEP